MKAQNTNYVVITPVRDEEEHLESTIQSMIGQTVLPKEWVIVDDGSKDGTGKIIDDYSSSLSMDQGRASQRPRVSKGRRRGC